MTSYSRRRPSEPNENENLLRSFQSTQKLFDCPTADSPLSFEDLPRHVFDSICDNISINDTISLSLTCKKIKEKVECHIYQHVRIIDIDNVVDEDELIIQKHFGAFKDESLETEAWWVYNNISELKSPKSILYFVYNILLNPSHGKYIKTIEINPNLKPSPWIRNRNNNPELTYWRQTLENLLSPEEIAPLKSHPLYRESLTLFDVLILLLEFTPNLENLIVARFALPDVSKLLVKTPNLKQLKIMINENDEFDVLPLNHLKYLKILRLKFQENTEPILEKLAVNFLKSDILSNLEVLVLKYDKTDFNHLTHPTWYSFFRPLFSYGKMVFSSLKKLELKDCFFDDNQSEIIENLSTIIPFYQIEWISLQIYEYSHKCLKHENCETNNKLNYKNTALSYLSPLLVSLKTLRIKPTKNCKLCQFDSILEFLKNHQNLVDIWISVDSLNKENYIKMLKTLHQFKKIEKLAYFDEFINNKLINNLKSWFLYQNKIVDFDIFKHYESEIFRQDIDPLFGCYRIEEFKRFNEREMSLLVLFWQKIIAEFELDLLMNKYGTHGADELKLFGYNFKIDRYRKVILIYVSKDVGYVDLKYYI